MANELIIPDDYGLFTVRFARDIDPTKFQSIHLGVLQGSVPDATLMLDQFVAAWTADGSLNEAQPNDVAAVNLNLRIVISGVLYSFDRADPWDAGGGGGNLLSPAVSTCIKTHTAQAGRKFRGRFQLPWASEDDVDEMGRIDQDVVDAYTAAARVFLDKINDDGTKLRSPYLLHTHAADDPTVIIDMTCRNTVGTVRRRQRVGH